MKKIVTFLVVLVASSPTLIKPYTGYYTDDEGNRLPENNINKKTIKGFRININCEELNGGCFWGSIFSNWNGSHRQLVKKIWINVSGSSQFCICPLQLQSHFPNADITNIMMCFPDLPPYGWFNISNPGFNYANWAIFGNC